MSIALNKHVTKDSTVKCVCLCMCAVAATYLYFRKNNLNSRSSYSSFQTFKVLIKLAEFNSQFQFAEEDREMWLKALKQEALR